MTTWILLILWTAFVAFVAYRYRDAARRLFDAAWDRVAAAWRFINHYGERRE